MPTATPTPPPATPEEIWAIIRETQLLHREIAERQKEADQRHREIDRMMKENAERQRETDRQMQETDRIVKENGWCCTKYDGQNRHMIKTA